MINETRPLNSFRVEIERFSAGTVATLAARLATRFFCFAAAPDHARHIIRRLCLFAAVKEPHLGTFPEPASPNTVSSSLVETM
jgi:hypothetical protein